VCCFSFVFFEQLNVTSPSAPALGSTAEVSPDHHDHGDEKQQQKPQQQSCHCPSWSLRRPCQWIYRGEGNASSKLILSLFQDYYLDWHMVVQKLFSLVCQTVLNGAYYFFFLLSCKNANNSRFGFTAGNKPRSLK